MYTSWVRTVGRAEFNGSYDDSLIEIADELADTLEGGDVAMFYTPNELTGIALHESESYDGGNYLTIYLWVYYPDEEIWVRNSPGLVEIRVPAEWEDSWETFADEILKIMPEFDLEEAEEIPAECVGGEDMETCWSEA